MNFSALAQCCSGTFANITYSSAAPWTVISDYNGDMSVSGGTGNFNTCTCSAYNRMYASLPGTLSNTQWVAEMKLTVSGGNGPAHLILAFTASNIDPICDETYTAVDNDGVWAELIRVTAPTSDACCPQSGGDWVFKGRSKDGTVLQTESNGITLPNGTSTVYIRLERYQTHGTLSVFSDNTFSTHLTGSPVCFTIPSTVTGLQYVQQGAITWGNTHRILSGTVDNLKICDSTHCSSNCIPRLSDGNENGESNIVVFPNPSNSFSVNIRGNESDFASPSTISIYDQYGTLVYFEENVNLNETTKSIDLNGYSKGIYLMKISSHNTTSYQKILLQ